MTRRPALAASALALFVFVAVPAAGQDIPTVLNANDAELYRRIFSAQERGDVAIADQALARLTDRLLVGHVLAHRYLHPRGRAQAGDLAEWLGQYADHPDAAAIHARARRLNPRLDLPAPAAAPVLPNLDIVDDFVPAERATPTRSVLTGASREAGRFITLVQRDLATGNYEDALTRLDSPRAAALNAGQLDFLRGQIAASLFSIGEDQRAFDLATRAAQGSGTAVPRAFWVLGLIHFKRGQFADAARNFETMAQAANGRSWDASAAAFWAARAHLRGRNAGEVTRWMRAAAEHPRTFYGLMATRLLGLQAPFVFTPVALDSAQGQALLQIPGARRAFALIQIGEDARAEAELRRLHTPGNAVTARMLAIVAQRASMPNLAMRMGRELQDSEGRRIVGALYPIPRWEPAGGFTVEPALVYAFMRQESAFNASARSRVGARGLMQVMPRTARHLRNSEPDLRSRHGISHPATNMALGQRYIENMLADGQVAGDLIRLAIAYNGGPGSLARYTRWAQNSEAAGDALLFIETIPNTETRLFVGRVLYNYWVYSMQLGRATPSLEEIAAGQWPRYQGTSRNGVANAQN